ncbi:MULTISPECIES: hypothetical protein [Enterobacterales]|uniref:hypothetical protein n=1 Tax=Yersiniaceae TaxID=1903411 RepID=UPI0018A311F6|nr:MULTISPECIES: hypothetical protein [Enterobacterales]BEO62132.1 hypothetical protein SMQE30_25550 [Serratia marcescens]MBF7995373.1 hypothetical protein [Rahnella laticis]MBP0996908.1 hypothetical protein [Serratia fonticola]MBP1001214.1 hypothetical protein [Serratia fonticola]MBP1011610.1 hypothetical protein [Serratia fonticola]
MNTFKNKYTEDYFIVSLKIYADLFNSKDKATREMIITHVMDHQFVSKLINLAMENAGKYLLENIWEDLANENVFEVDFKEVKQALTKIHYTTLAESIC